MGIPTRYSNGISNAPDNSFEDLADFPLPSPIRLTGFFDDFHTYLDGANWITTQVGGGTTALVGGRFGVIQITPGGTDDDYRGIFSGGSTIGTSFTFDETQDMWFQSRMVLANPAATSIYAWGILDGVFDARPTDPGGFENGILFRSNGTELEFVLARGGAETVRTVVTGMGPGQQFIKADWHYDAARRTFNVYINDRLVNSELTSDEAPVGAFEQCICAAVEHNGFQGSLQIDYLGCWQAGDRPLT